MLRVLLVTDTDKPIGDLRQALMRLGYEMLAVKQSEEACTRMGQQEVALWNCSVQL